MIDRCSAVESDNDLVVAVGSVVHTDRIGPKVSKGLAQLDHVRNVLIRYAFQKAAMFLKKPYSQMRWRRFQILQCSGC